jgi:hypothetical protein
VVFGIFLPVFFSIPIWALFTHQFILKEPFWHYLIVRTPYLFLYLFSNRTGKLFNRQAQGKVPVTIEKLAAHYRISAEMVRDYQSKKEID